MTQIGKYEIVRRTGETSLGTTYEAFDPVMRRTVSIQAPGDDEESHPQAHKETSQIALQKGGESLGRLNHPNIQNIIATEEADGTIYLVLEHVNARPISQQASRQGLGPAEALPLLKMAGQALDHAHAHGVLHPGLTPAHLLVDDSGLLKLAGFEMSGLQGLSLQEVSQTDLDLLLSSLPYRAPEFLAGEAVDARADQHSLAVIALELLTGAKAMEENSPLMTMGAVLAGTLPDLRLLDGRMPAAVRRVFERAVAADPSARYDSCSAMFEALEAALRTADALARVTPAPVAKPSGSTGALAGGTGAARVTEQLAAARRKNTRRIQMIVAGVCVAAAALIVFILLQSKPIVSPPVQVTATPTPEPGPVLMDSTPARVQVHNVVDSALQKAGTAATAEKAGPDGTANAGAELQPPARATQAKKPKRPKATPELQMPEVTIGR